MAQIKAADAGLAKVKEQLKGKPQLQSQAEKLETEITAIAKGTNASPDGMGLEAATSGLQSALRVVEGGDRTTPQQALEVYKLSDEAAKNGIAAWQKLKSGELADFNRSLEKAGVRPIEMSAVENEDERALSD
jgi:hypothetical protein